MVTFASACLPYVPQFFRSGRVYGVSHSQLVTWLQYLLTDESLSPNDNLVIYKQQPNLIYAMSRPDNLDAPWPRVAVKRFGWRGKQHYLLSPLKRSKALKSYRTACYLLAQGLSTPMPLGACDARRWGFVQSNVYVTEDIADYITLREYWETLPDGPKGMEEVMQLVAAYTRCMHDSGLWHRDLFLANFLMTGPPGKRRLYLIDLNRARRLPFMPAWLRALDMARMEWRTWQPQFLALYSDGCFSTHRMLWITRLYRRWRDVRYRVLKVINPLRKRLGLK
ncbi:MAG: lipopolysaccharide kinase InaA family protein [Candidatus Tectomicrobia bacterium]